MKLKKVVILTILCAGISTGINLNGALVANFKTFAMCNYNNTDNKYDLKSVNNFDENNPVLTGKKRKREKNEKIEKEKSPQIANQ